MGKIDTMMLSALICIKKPRKSTCRDTTKGRRVRSSRKCPIFNTDDFDTIKNYCERFNSDEFLGCKQMTYKYHNNNYYIQEEEINEE